MHLRRGHQRFSVSTVGWSPLRSLPSIRALCDLHIDTGGHIDTIWKAHGRCMAEGVRSYDGACIATATLCKSGAPCWLRFTPCRSALGSATRWLCVLGLALCACLNLQPPGSCSHGRSRSTSVKICALRLWGALFSCGKRVGESVQRACDQRPRFHTSSTRVIRTACWANKGS